MGFLDALHGLKLERPGSLSLTLGFIGYALPVLAVAVAHDGEMGWKLPAARAALGLSMVSILACFTVGVIGAIRNLQPRRSVLGAAVALFWPLGAIWILKL